MPRIKTKELDIAQSIEFDKELFLEEFVSSLHISRDEFERLYILEEHPILLSIADYSGIGDVDIVLNTRQEFIIRRKTPEEMTEDFSHSLTQGVN